MLGLKLNHVSKRGHCSTCCCWCVWISMYVNVIFYLNLFNIHIYVSQHHRKSNGVGHQFDYNAIQLWYIFKLSRRVCKCNNHRTCFMDLVPGYIIHKCLDSFAVSLHTSNGRLVCLSYGCERGIVSGLLKLMDILNGQMNSHCIARQPKCKADETSPQSLFFCLHWVLP